MGDEDMEFAKDFYKSILASQMDSNILPNIQLPESSHAAKQPYQLTLRRNPALSALHSIFRQEWDLDAEEQNTSQLLTTEQLQLRWQVATDLLFLLRRHYSACELYVFGSLLTGLGDHNSDIDIYVDSKGDGGKYMDSDKFQIIYELQDAVAEILESVSCPHDSSKKFADEVELLGVRVPIVRLRHAQTGILCDLSFGNGISVQNSKLFKFYMSFDPRVKPLIVFLRYWADFHGLSGSHKIKKYAISLLALVYLTGKKILPSINTLQILAAAERSNQGLDDNPYLIDGWDSSFSTDSAMIETLFEATPLPPDYENNSTNVVMQMALEFFEIMLSTNFAEVVVCPLMGKIISKDCFVNYGLAKENLPRRLKKWRQRYRTERFFCKTTKILNPLVIQDPFDLDFNVSGLVDKDTLNAFNNACLSTFNILKNRPKSILSLLFSFVNK